MLNDDLREENLKLRAENRRLRVALKKIRDLDFDDSEFDFRSVARAALDDVLPGTHHDNV